MASATLAPLRENQRIQLIDAVRGFALLGILLMNSMAQSQSHFFYDTLDLRQPIVGANFWAWAVECGLFEGTMRGLFSILFGAGTILLITRLEKNNKGLAPADIYYRRLLWLLVFGLINAFVFLWPGDILYPYAVCGLLLFPFRNWSARSLLWAAFFFLAIATYRSNSRLYETKDLISKGQTAEALAARKATLSDAQKEDLTKYQGFREKNSQQGIAKQVVDEEKKIKGQSYASIFTYYKSVNMKLQSKGMYNGVWDILIFFFIGMALFKNGFLSGKKPVSLYLIIGIIGTASGVWLNYMKLRADYNVRFDVVQHVQQWKFGYYEIRRVLQTMGYLSLLILLYKLAPFRRIFNVLAPVGQMAFTNYLSQSIITSIIFYGFGYFAALQRYQVYYVVFAIWAFQIVFSNIWLHYYRFGPFEWVWRSLTYWKAQPMKRKAVETESAAEEQSGDDVVPAIA